MRHTLTIYALAPLLCTACVATSAEGDALAGADAAAMTCPVADCKAEGLCTLTGSGCVAANAQDCRPSAACLNEGRCCADDGQCVAQKVIP